MLVPRQATCTRGRAGGEVRRTGGGAGGRGQRGREEEQEVNDKEAKEKIVGDEEKGGVAREGREKDEIF